MVSLKWCHDIQHDDTKYNGNQDNNIHHNYNLVFNTQNNNTQHKETQHKETQHNYTQHNETKRNNTDHNDTQHNDNLAS